MTVWIIIPVGRISDGRTAYRRLSRLLDEDLGTPQFNRDGSLAFFGSSRITGAEARKLNSLPGVSVTRNSDFMRTPDWELSSIALNP